MKESISTKQLLDCGVEYITLYAALHRGEANILEAAIRMNEIADVLEHYAALDVTDSRTLELSAAAQAVSRQIQSAIEQAGGSDAS